MTFFFLRHSNQKLKYFKIKETNIKKKKKKNTDLSMLKDFPI